MAGRSPLATPELEGWTLDALAASYRLAFCVTANRCIAEQALERALRDAVDHPELAGHGASSDARRDRVLRLRITYDAAIDSRRPADCDATRQQGPVSRSMQHHPLFRLDMPSRVTLLLRDCEQLPLVDVARITGQACVEARQRLFYARVDFRTGTREPTPCSLQSC